MKVFYSEAVNSSENLGKMLFFALGGGGQAVDHVSELLIGQRSIIDNSAVSWNKGQLKLLRR